MKGEWEWSNVWQIIVILIILTVLGLGVTLIFAPKNVDYYYLSTENNGAEGLGFCVYAHWTWHIDEIAYCSDDKDRALEFATKANLTLQHK